MYERNIKIKGTKMSSFLVEFSMKVWLFRNNLQHVNYSLVVCFQRFISRRYQDVCRVWQWDKKPASKRLESAVSVSFHEWNNPTEWWNLMTRLPFIFTSFHFKLSFVIYIYLFCCVKLNRCVIRAARRIFCLLYFICAEFLLCFVNLL